MELIVSRNKLHDQEQTISLDSSVLTLIGENGCGKSSILEALFEEYVNSDNYNTICFSSGQNELFTKIFDKHKWESRRYVKQGNSSIVSFYFNYSWVRILVFFASVLKSEGLVRKFLVQNNYITEREIVDGGKKEDISSRLHTRFKVRKSYKNKILREIEKEETGEITPNDESLRRSDYNVTLEKILSTFNINFTLDDDARQNLRRTQIDLTSTNVYNIFRETTSEKIFSFLSLSTYGWEANFEFKDFELYFNNNFEFKQLSDGEYQLLSIYAIIDLFDSENTIFLFDEIDSHLHFKNLEKLWNLLQNSIYGKVITTTHISDSILNNNFSNIKLIQRGKIEHDLTLRELAKRLTNIVGKKKYELQLATRIENIVLVDNEDDWVIFRKLAEKKIDEDTNQVFSKLIPFKRTSSYNNDSEIFGKGKLQFAKDFREQLNGSQIQTKQIFMICDRDKLSKNSIDNEMKVNIHNDYRDIRNFNGVHSHLLSWKRMEIENYLISVSMLIEKGKIQDLRNIFPRVNFTVNDNLDNSSDIEEYDAKELLHPLYKPDGFNETELDELVSLIPKEEISEDIVTMYNYLKNNIAN